jgi:class 3 adenylate cyclase/TolB-like protein/Tfp pilus assembly protein PilF
MDEVHLKRRLTAVLLADVVGYSRLMSLDEEGTHRRLANYAQNLIDPAVIKHHGRLIRSMGDGMLVEFDSAVDAVRCGVEMQRGLAEREDGETDLRIQLRIGINTGDVIVDDRDIYGNSINIAARLEGLAEPGQIYVTRGVRDQLLGHPNLRFEDKGERRVKNIDRPIRVYRVEYDGEARPKLPSRDLVAIVRRLSRAASPLNSRSISLIGGILLAILAILGMAAPPAWFRNAALPPRASIVVMPFNNFSGDSEQGYVADAITDDVTTDLARLKGTFVIARNTAFTFKGRSVDARQVGKECGVRYMLEGSITRAGNRIETNVQLIDTQTGAHVWADRFVHGITDFLKLEKAITGRIATSLNIQLIQAEGRRLTDEQARNPDAVDLRFRGMSLYFSSITPKHSQEAREYLEEAVRRDPQSAEAWGWLAEILVMQYVHRWNNAGKPELKQAEDAVLKAQAIDPNIGQVYYAEGLVRRANGEHNAALEAFTRAFELDPSLTRALAEKANELTLVGRPAEAPALVETAIKLSPHDPSLGGFYWIIGRAYFYSGNYREAIPWLRQSVGLRQNDWFNRLYLVSAYALDGQTDEAKKTLQDFYNNPRFTGYTLQKIESDEKATPNDNKLVVSVRQKFHDGLQIAGMAAR